MKLLALTVLLLISSDPREITKINSIKKEAEKAFLDKNFILAASKYQFLDSMGVKDDAIKLNMAHAFYQLKDTASAKSTYNTILSSPNKKLKSIAYQQLGVMEKNENKLEEALQSLKYSIKSDPTNEGARYDYELVKKLLEEQKKQEQEQEDQKQDEQNQEQQENQDQQQGEDENNEEQEGEESDEQQDQEGEQEESEDQEGDQKENEEQEGEEQESEKEPTPEEMMKEKLEEMNISPEKAKMILEAMRNNEVQYLQQQKRKATERPKTGKPDW
jgi:cobalamin biosynthesis protein CobT